MKNRLLLTLPLLLLLASCEDGQQNDDIVKTPEKADASIETKISIRHSGDQFDIMRTESFVWNKKQLVKKIVRIDTLAPLGTTTEVAEDEDGDDSTIVVPKNYQLFITVK